MTDLADEVKRVFEILVGLAREADDEITGQGDIRTRCLDAGDQFDIGAAAVLAVHGAQDLVRAGLHRQMQIGHQFRQIAVRLNEVVAHVVRVRGRVAQAVYAVDFGQGVHQLCQRRLGACIHAVIGVDVLTQKRDFAYALGGQGARLVEYRSHGAGPLGAARIGHDAEGAKLVAAFLDG